MKAKILFMGKSPIRVYVEKDFTSAVKDKDFLVENIDAEFSLVDTILLDEDIRQDNSYATETMQTTVNNFLRVCEPFELKDLNRAFNIVKEEVTEGIIDEEFKAIFNEFYRFNL